MLTCGNLSIGPAHDLANGSIRNVLMEFHTTRGGWTPLAPNVGLLVLTRGSVTYCMFLSVGAYVGENNNVGACVSNYDRWNASMKLRASSP